MSSVDDAQQLTRIADAMTKNEEDARILEKALEAFYSEYREQTDVWRTLEQKAQVTAGLAGVFLAAIFGFARDHQPGTVVALAVGFALLFLLVSIWYAAQVLRVKEFTLPDNAAEIMATARRLVGDRNAGDGGARYMELLEALLEGNEEVVVTLDKANKEKRDKLACAHVWFALAIVLSAIATWVRLII